ncbi:MAG: DEAD/DEAH box helicase [Gemmatimonadales bacterium]|jgi:superfamily II DNA or RNA helicase|nr:DEAD/DEAH box helicase [Gemmatimonadales bacterium]
MNYSPGSLVNARGREWVVLPSSTDDLLMVRPIGGTDGEQTGIYLPIEGADVSPASFDPPDPRHVGDNASCRLLRDATRLGLRTGAGPFRCFAKIAVEPRPYQLVPLLMALKLDPVRVLIADDVGVGKTIEACLVARELLDRGEIQRLAVLCPPHLAEQWQAELHDKFHIEAELVLSSTANRLERSLYGSESLFEAIPYTVVSTDFIKTDRRRAEFLRSCPEFVIVDEAHTCAYDETTRSGRHQRHALVRDLGTDADRHLVLVTATPHTGNEGAFRSLLGLLNPDFADLPEDLSGSERAPLRQRIARHFVQRRRGDIRQYVEAVTQFPDREEREESYQLAASYKKLFDRALEYAREIVLDEREGRHRQRVRWWSMLALLRTLASSPAAAAATLRTRAASVGSETADDADEAGRRVVMDLDDADGDEAPDVVPGSDYTEEGDDRRERDRLNAMARDAEKLMGKQDAKLSRATDLVNDLLADGYAPILFCRYIATAEYVAAELRKRLANGIEVRAVTGQIQPRAREEQVQELGQAPRRVLVCTDCLSEGINLQEHFNAVMHYDLSWNPTRHEQREGRVDRYGQASPTVRTLTYYGMDNRIDGVVLDVLLRKHKTIRTQLGITVPVPGNTDDVVEAIFEGLLLREDAGGSVDPLLPGFDDFLRRQEAEVHAGWEAAADREKQSRTMFAQNTIRPEEVAEHLRAAQEAVGSGVDVRSFVEQAVRMHRGSVDATDRGTALRVDVRSHEVHAGFRDAVGATEFTARFELPVGDGEIHLHRTQPIIEAMADHLVTTAIDPLLAEEAVARRAGVIRTADVERATTLLLVRFRYDLTERRPGRETRTMLAEDCDIVGFTGTPSAAEWLDADAVENALAATPSANVVPEQATERVQRVVQAYDSLSERLASVADARAAALLQMHQTVREASRATGVRHAVSPKLPVDILGIYVYLPAGGALR